jgi:hypothetical protein
VKRPIVLADGLSLPLDAVTRTFGIFGQRGTGKSTTAAVLVEQIVKAGARAVALDPTGVWYGLTREGSGPGLTGVVLGGEQQDAPLNPQSGALVAEFVMGSDYPFVALDLKLMRKHERQHFAMEFLEALYHDNRDPLLVVFDEAAQFAPQQMREKGDVPRLLGAVEDLVKLGRSRGLGAVMIEQRIATLNANVREQIETLVAQRLIGPLDRKALKEWIAAQGEPEREAEALALIPKLQPGTALVWSPSFLKFFGQVAVHNATTFDSRATPEVGKKRRALTARAPVDLDALRTRMAATIEKAKADDPKALRQELAALKKQLAAAQAAKPEPKVERVEVPILTDKERDKIQGTCDRVEALAGALAASLKIMGEAAAGIRSSLSRPGPVAAQPLRPRRSEDAVVRRASAPPPRLPSNRNGHGETPAKGALTGPQRKLLIALAQHGRMSKVKLALLTNYSHQGGGFLNPLGSLRTSGFVSYAGDAIEATQAGIDMLGDFEPLPTGRELLERWLGQLDGPMSKLLRCLADAYPDSISVEDLAESTGYSAKGGGFLNPLGRLRTLQLVSGRGEVRASDALFDTAGAR